MKIGTDPKAALNFALRKAFPAGLKEFLGKERVPIPLIVGAAAKEAKKRIFKELGLAEEEINAYNGYRDLRPKCGSANAPPPPKCSKNGPAHPPNLLAYKAGPLEGIWATAPYLHNGAIPNLYQLLLPPQQRVKSFYVGNREFDPKNVGFISERFEGGFEFNTELPGNSNRGHEYGIKLSEQERWELVEFLKSL